MVFAARNIAGRLSLLLGGSRWGFWIHRGHGFMLDSGAGNSARYAESKYRGGGLGRMELYSRRSFFDETSLAVSPCIDSFGLCRRVFEVAKSHVAPAFGIGSLGVGLAFSFATQRGNYFL